MVSVIEERLLCWQIESVSGYMGCLKEFEMRCRLLRNEVCFDGYFDMGSRAKRAA